MNQKIIKVFLVLVMCLTLLIPNYVFAKPEETGTGVSGASTSSSSSDFNPSMINPSSSNSGELNNIGGKVVGTIQAIGIVISVVVIIVLGIKYMLGSVEEKAQYKKSMLPYLIGAILTFSAVTIANVVYNFAMGLK